MYKAHSPGGEEPGALEVAQYAVGLLQLFLFIDNGVLKIVAIVAAPTVINIAWEISLKINIIIIFLFLRGSK